MLSRPTNEFIFFMDGMMNMLLNEMDDDGDDCSIDGNWWSVSILNAIHIGITNIHVLPFFQLVIPFGVK